MVVLKYAPKLARVCFHPLRITSVRFPRLAHVAVVLFHCCVVFHSMSHRSPCFMFSTALFCLFLSLLTDHTLQDELLEGDCSLFVLLPTVSLASRAMSSHSKWPMNMC